MNNTGDKARAASVGKTGAAFYVKIQKTIEYNITITKNYQYVYEYIHSVVHQHTS